jgi:hypothetical protein
MMAVRARRIPRTRPPLQAVTSKPFLILAVTGSPRFGHIAACRTLRTNLRFIGRGVVPQFYPADLPLPRERSKEPYSAAEIGGSWRWRMPSPRWSGGCARPGLSAWGRVQG